jgi:membrane protease subunit HflC
VILVECLWTSLVLVDETEFVVVERLGKINAVYDRPADRGLHFKLPWPIDAVRRFDRRVQLFDPIGREIFTQDKKNVTVDAYICWRIAASPNAQQGKLSDRPVVRFFRGLGSVDVAEARLDSRLRSILSTQIGHVELSKLLSVADSEDGPDATETGTLENVGESVRAAVMQRVGDQDSLTDRLGIEIVDVRIKRLNFPSGNQQAVFERMKSERKKIADDYRYAGMADNEEIKSQADRQHNEILAKARADAERIRGEAEAEAIGTLNRAHARDPEFYKLMQTLDAYRKILNERTTLVLSASSNLLKLLTEGIPEPGASADEPTSPTVKSVPDPPSDNDRKKKSAPPIDKTAPPGEGAP